MIKILEKNEYGLFSICSILQNENILSNIDASFLGYYNVYHLLNDFMNGTVYCFACYSTEDKKFPDGLILCMVDSKGYMECHLGFKKDFPLNKKLSCMQETIDLIHKLFPECKGIVGYPPKKYRHVLFVVRKLGFKKSETNVKFFGADNNIDDCIKVCYEFKGVNK